jgi:hypothetical protein
MYRGKDMGDAALLDRFGSDFEQVANMNQLLALLNHGKNVVSDAIFTRSLVKRIRGYFLNWMELAEAIASRPDKEEALKIMLDAVHESIEGLSKFSVNPLLVNRYPFSFVMRLLVFRLVAATIENAEDLWALLASYRGDPGELITLDELKLRLGDA